MGRGPACGLPAACACVCLNVATSGNLFECCNTRQVACVLAASRLILAIGYMLEASHFFGYMLEEYRFLGICMKRPINRARRP